MAIFLGKLVRLTGLEPTRRIDTSTSSWPVYQFQHSRKHEPPKKDCLIIIAIPRRNVNQKSRDFSNFFLCLFQSHFLVAFLIFLFFSELLKSGPGKKSFLPGPFPPKNLFFLPPALRNPPDTGCLHNWARTSPMGSVMTSPAARSRATADLLMSTSRSP